MDLQGLGFRLLDAFPPKQGPLNPKPLPPKIPPTPLTSLMKQPQFYFEPRIGLRRKIFSTACSPRHPETLNPQTETLKP